MATRNSFKSGSCEMIVLHILKITVTAMHIKFHNISKNTPTKNYIFPRVLYIRLFIS